MRVSVSSGPWKFKILVCHPQMNSTNSRVVYELLFPIKWVSKQHKQLKLHIEPRSFSYEFCVRGIRIVILHQMGLFKQHKQLKLHTEAKIFPITHSVLIQSPTIFLFCWLEHDFFLLFFQYCFKLIIENKNRLCLVCANLNTPYVPKLDMHF